VVAKTQGSAGPAFVGVCASAIGAHSNHERNTEPLESLEIPFVAFERVRAGTRLGRKCEPKAWRVGCAVSRLTLTAETSKMLDPRLCSVFLQNQNPTFPRQIGVRFGKTSGGRNLITLLVGAIGSPPGSRAAQPVHYVVALSARRGPRVGLTHQIDAQE